MVGVENDTKVWVMAYLVRGRQKCGMKVFSSQHSHKSRHGDGWQAAKGLAMPSEFALERYVMVMDQIWGVKRYVPRLGRAPTNAGAENYPAFEPGLRPEIS